MHFKVTLSAHPFVYPLLLIAAFWVALWVLKVTAIGTVRTIDHALRPIERVILLWLQDRAMARALGVDIDTIRVRRKIETTAKPIDVPIASGSKTHF